MYTAAAPSHHLALPLIPVCIPSDNNKTDPIHPCLRPDPRDTAERALKGKLCGRQPHPVCQRAPAMAKEHPTAAGWEGFSIPQLHGGAGREGWRRQPEDTVRLDEGQR